MWRANELRGVTVAAVALAFCVLLGGCSDRLTQRRFSLIKVSHSTQEDVKVFVGRPDEKFADRWTYSRPDKHLAVTVTFDEDGVVTRKEWVDPDRWIDTDEPLGETSKRESSRSIKIRQTTR